MPEHIYAILCTWEMSQIIFTYQLLCISGTATRPYTQTMSLKIQKVLPSKAPLGIGPNYVRILACVTPKREPALGGVDPSPRASAHVA